ncbi:MAG: tRNA (adenosine(37)-N6)-threonylcarbamoyltransferase complex dimerization subunit type 1 TsaB [bacterium]|nr:tRNA (adenosine(37)-N6)-threonylcarbamoyltransferase complex dimerization subunit type 1 TsaB [bacterium]
MILFLDTSTSKCRVWLDEVYFERDFGREMARQTLAFLEEILAERGANWQNLTGLALFAGPGSFTGLRIGTTILNTLADSLEIPIVSATNSDFSKNEDENSKEDWREIAKIRLSNQENDQIAMPFYGREARITKPRK